MGVIEYVAGLLRRIRARIVAFLILRRLRSYFRGRVAARARGRAIERVPLILEATTAGARHGDGAWWWPELAPLTDEERTRVRSRVSILRKEKERG